MSDVTTLQDSGPTDATLGGSTWVNAPGTPFAWPIVTMKETDTTTSTNGVDCLNVTIPESGLYLLSGYILITQASDAVTSHALRVVFAYDDTATTSYAGGTDVSALNAASSRSEHFIALCIKDTVATVAIASGIVGTKTVGTGKYRLAFAITKL